MPRVLSVSSEDFLHRVRDYLPMDAEILATDGRGRGVGDPLWEGPPAEVFHQFDADSVLAVSHAIEELALEHAHGELVACMQDFRFFGPHRDRYWQLAATLDHVCVMARGRRRPPHDHLKFCPATDPAVLTKWGVLYAARGMHLGFLVRQVNQAARFEQRRFVGFYTMDAGIVTRLQAELRAVQAGEATCVPEFDRLESLDRGLKRLREAFAGEEAGLVAVLAGLRRDGRDGGGELGVALRRSLRRLERVGERIRVGLGGEDVRERP